MGWQLAPYTFPFAVSATISLLIMIPVFQSRDQRGAIPLMGVLLGGFFWSIGPGLRLASTTEWAKLFWYNVRFLGPTIATPAIFLFVAEYTNRPQWLTRYRVALLILPAVLTNVMVWTNHFHNLVFAETTLVTSGAFVRLEIAFGPYFWAQTLYHYFILIAATSWLVLNYWQVRNSGTRTHRTQALLILCAMLIPWVANIMFVTGVSEIDITPFGFVATGGLFAAAMFRYRLLDILPIARGTVVENMDNGIIVLDIDNNIVDMNPWAREQIGFDGEDPVGLSFEEVFGEYPVIIEKFADVRETQDQISIRRDGRKRHYGVKVSPIRNSIGTYVGRTVVFTDNTRQIERQQELELMRQVQSRVLRHNIRNNIQAIKSNTQIVARDVTEKKKTTLDKVTANANDLLSISEKARDVEQLVDGDQHPTTIDLRSLFVDMIAIYQSKFPEVAFHHECPNDCQVTTIPAMRIAFENLIENAAEHNDADNPCVNVIISENTDATRVTVSDNGPGVPDHEFSVLETGEETSLEHGSGIGLWVVQWVVDYSTATIKYDTGDSGTEVTICFPKSSTNG